MRIACWITKATDTYTLKICNIIAFPLPQLLQEHATLLRYTYVACIVIRGTDCVFCAVRADRLNL